MAVALDDRRAWYAVRDGRRHVLPYSHRFESFAKGRWVGRRVLDVMAEEFPEHPADYFGQAAVDGRLTVNDGPVSREDAFAHGDRLVHCVERTEPSVPATPIEVLHAEEDLLALAKPAGMPVHHAGRYRRNTLVEILQVERPELTLGGDGGGGLHVLHRLDRQVSGVLLLPRTPAAAKELGAAMQGGQMHKLYLARVEGELTPPTAFTVSAAVRVRSERGVTVCDCHSSGKPAATLFRALGYDAASGTSLILAEPFSGRPHQIRLHLQIVGAPISNDPLYRRLPRSHRGLPHADGAAGGGGARQRAGGNGEEGGGEEGGGECEPTASSTEPPSKRSTSDVARRVAAEEKGAADASADGRADELCADELWLHAWHYACEPRPLAPASRTFAVSAPAPGWVAPFDPPSLPALLAADAPIALASDAGRALLCECALSERAAYDHLWPHFAPQQSRTLCGPASVAMLLRAAHAGRVTSSAGEGARSDALAAISEASVLDSQRAVAPAKVRAAGLSLPQMAALLSALRLAPLVHHAAPAEIGPTSVDEELSRARGGLRVLADALRQAPSTLTILNYHMGAAGQRPFGGHFSPLGAFHQRTGRYLVLDVWPDTGPCWCTGERLWAAMVGYDAESGLSRGWLTVDLANWHLDAK